MSASSSAPGDLCPVLFYKQLADDTRLRALLLITQEEELCVCELVVALDASQPKISRHLAQLRKTGLLQDRRQGQWIFYRLSYGLPKWCQQVLATTVAANRDWLQQAQQQLKTMGDRPQRLKSCC